MVYKVLIAGSRELEEAPFPGDRRMSGIIKKHSLPTIEHKGLSTLDRKSPFPFSLVPRWI